MKPGILFLIILCLLQAAALAAEPSYFEGNLEGVEDDDDGIATLFFVLNLLLYGVMLASQLELLPQQRNPSVFDQRLMWADFVKRHSRRNGTFTRRLRMEVGSFDKLLEIIREDLEVDQDMANL
jgi:hypothetical protein